MNRVAVGVAILIVSQLCAAADKYLVKAYPNKCVQGLYQQPAGGPFSVFLFCDDALGSNIGIINTAGGAGPGSIPLHQPREWSNWNVNDRFWQQPEWASDVTSFAWAPDLRSLYIGTSEVYGSGNLYKLDLVNRTFEKLVPDSKMHLAPNHGYTTEIMSIDRKTGEVTVSLEAFDEPSQRTQATKLKVK